MQATQEGIEACNTEADVDDTLVQLVGQYATGLAVQAGGRCGGDPAAMNAKHVTIIGDNSSATPAVGAVQVFAAAYPASLDLRHSIIRGIANTIAWTNTAGASATIGSTDADLSAGAQTGTPGTLKLAGGNIDRNPRFVNPGVGQLPPSLELSGDRRRPVGAVRGLGVEARSGGPAPDRRRRRQRDGASRHGCL